MADMRVLSKLRDQYQAKADRYYESYQMDGQTSALRAYERNEAMADALTDAMAAQDTKEQLIALKAMVMELRPDDERGDLALEVKRLKRRVSEGRL